MIDLTKVTDIILDGVDMKDYPDFCDAFILSADYDGKEMTYEQLDELNKESEFVHHQVMSLIC